MPTYEYRCKDCGEDLEVVQSFTDDALTVCPTCGGTLRKVFGNIGVTFKGSGFYKTDSRNGSGSKAKPSEKAEKAESSSDTKSSTDSSSSSDSGSKDSSSSTTKSDTKSDAKKKSTPAKSA